MEGTLVRRYGGFYYVESDGQVWTCRLRGRFRLQDAAFLPGDRVIIKPVGPGEGVIEDLLPRRTCLERPAVANVEQAIIVFALGEPPPDLELLDRLLFLSGVKDLETAIIWNKADIIKKEFQDLPGIYRQIGYRSLVTSARTGEGIDELKAFLAGRLSTFAGPSGVGKSSLLNAIQPGLNLRTGEVSSKSRRGRHTTRQAELIRIPEGGWVADTPGFSRLDLPSLTREEVAGYFPEMLPLQGQCRFTSCLHRREPGCAVKAALDAGRILPHRYEHYLAFLAEVIAGERSF
ncbi:ribosome small subunit-dependent GTPase A [Moorella sp. Hama-1]|uniref:ribosome small subunit-dependent GTPase A n=1 Tax=Moorella sp. Hama-1 TaxID=2138101 RepID=UPI000D642DFE|nr:ribosome small subunit-dependent GTPase A [Moorella sp. Hama-1]BCV20978.1 putative ribosome biogenesis GTPase RsgA [Moorella sp. Hama-1]